MLRRNPMKIRLITGLIKKISLHKMSYYPKPNSPSKNKIKVELALSSYAKKKKKSDVKMQQALKHRNLLKTLVQLK